MTTRAPGRLIPLAGLGLCLAACAAGTEEVSQAGSLQVVNNTSYTIAELYVSPAGAGTWGPDQLASPIAPSGTFTLTGIAASNYDFMAIASNGITFWQTSSVSITAGGAATWTLPQPDVGSLSVVNNHCLPLAELYLTPSSAPTWGPIHLLTPVDPLGTFTLTDIPVGTYDAYAVAIDGVNWTTYGIPITAGGDYPWGPLYMPAGTGCLRVVNQTALTIAYLYDPPSPSGCTNDNWGNLQLSPATIPPCSPPAPCSSFTLSNVPAGARDLRARDLGFTMDSIRCSAAIPSGGTFTWLVIP